MMDKDRAADLMAILTASKEFESVITPLHEDLQYHAKMLDTDGGQFWRRSFVRALFAFIEGTMYRMKQIALASQFPPSVDFSLPERALLAEESYDLDDKGNIKTKDARIPLFKNMKFSFRAFAKGYLAEYQLKTDNGGWDAFLKSIKIRDRLTHPKQAADLIVSDDENKILLRAFIWFDSSIKEVQSVSVRAMQESLTEQNPNVTSELWKDRPKGE